MDKFEHDWKWRERQHELRRPEGRDVEQFSDEFAEANVPYYVAVRQLYADNGVPFVSAVQIASEIQAAASGGIKQRIK